MKQVHEHLLKWRILYWANQERMMAYDQAGNAAKDQRLKDFFFEKSGESEQAAESIGEVMHAKIPTGSKHDYVLPGARLFERFLS